MKKLYKPRPRYRDAKEALEHAYWMNYQGQFKAAQSLLEIIIRHVVKE
jgi:hypothetical protein